jgi:hypothetical protein
LLEAPAVGLWLAEQRGKRIQGVTDVATYWRNLAATLKKKLPPEVLLTNRYGTAKALADWAAGNPGPLAIRAFSPREMADVFVAWVHTLPTAEADAVSSRAIIVEDAETWKALATSKQSLILIAGPGLETTPDLLAEATRQHADIEALAVRWRSEADPPLRRVAAVWEFVSPQDAWTLLHSALTSSRADAFESAIVEVLGENNPALDLPAKERFLRSIQGRHHKYSEQLRRGLAEILALSAGLASENLVTDDYNFINRARRIVSRLLAAGCSWKRWASLGDLLPLLAEAAPEEFLNAVDQDLKSPTAELVELMRQENGDAITGAVYHAGLLWALETLAWTTKYTARVADLLAKLAALDPGGRWINRPSASLRNLFFSWRPQTKATLDELLVILKRLTKTRPDVAWKLLLDLLPEHQSAITDSHKPSPWRSWAAGWTGEVTQTDFLRYISGLVGVALDLAAGDGTRWPDLLDHCTALLPVDRSRIFAAIEQINPAALSGKERLALWEKLRQIVQKHTAFHDADWALPPAEAEHLGRIRDCFAPQDEVRIAEPLFTDPEIDYENLDLPSEEREARLRRRRQEAVKRVWDTGGLPAVLTLARKVRDSWLVGIALAQAIEGEPEAQIVPDLLCSSEPQIEGFAAGYTVMRIDAKGRDWAERLPSVDWSAEQVAAFARRMPFDVRAWDWVENASADVKRFYWAKVGFSRIPEEPTHLETAVRKLFEAKRPNEAVRLLGMGVQNKVPVSSALLFDVLEAMLGAEIEDWRALETYYIQQFIKRLQANAQADESRLGHLEFSFLPLLSPHTLRPHTLERLLGRDPKLFVDCLKLLYRPRHESGQEKPADPDGREAEKARFVWHLLHDWQRLPGTQPDGSISASELRAWVDAARAAAREADRLEVCDVKIGEVFAHAPEDDSGAKPCLPVREIIEEFASDCIDRGFATGLFNLQGPYSKSLDAGGHQEREVAATYERYAKACEIEWPRTAAALRSVVQSYLDWLNMRTWKRACENKCAGSSRGRHSVGRAKHQRFRPCAVGTEELQEKTSWLGSTRFRFRRSSTSRSATTSRRVRMSLRSGSIQRGLSCRSDDNFAGAWYDNFAGPAC